MTTKKGDEIEEKMKEYETDLGGKFLVREEEINIIYDGPSFDGRMEIADLTSQLKSTENIIREIVYEIYKQKGLKNPKDTKIYIKLKKGSFHEIISIFFNNPIMANIVGGCIVALFTYYLTKNKQEVPSVKIENLTNNYFFAKNLNQIINPLESQKDKIEIISSNGKNKTSLFLKDKKIMNKVMRELKKQIAIEVYQEEFFGYLSVVDIDKEKYGFTLEGTDRHIPVIFDDKPNLKEIKEILGFRLKVKVRAIYEEKELKKIEIEKYEIKRRKNLNDFGKNKNDNFHKR